MEKPQYVKDALNSTAFNDPNKITKEDCINIAKTSNDIPEECRALIEQARKDNLLPRRASSVTKTWNPHEGHGKRSFYFEKDGIDNNNPAGTSSTVDEHFLSGKTPEQREKIRQLRTRMSARGALNVTGVNMGEVAHERYKELQRRQSRREELKQTPPGVMPSN